MSTRRRTRTSIEATGIAATGSGRRWSDPPAPVDPPDPPDPRRFRRAVVAVVGVLAVAAAGLGGLSALQGPRVQSSAIDTASAVATPTSLRLVMNQGVAGIDPEQVTVTPAADVAVRTDGDLVLLDFARALAFGTTYRVEIDGVRSVGGGAASTVRQEFTTPGFEPTWIRPGPDGDQVVRARIGEEPQVLAEAPVIDDVLPIDAALLLLTRDAAGASVLEVVSDDGPERQALTLPADTRLGLLADAGTSVLFTAFGTDQSAPDALSAALFRIDLAAEQVLEPVLGLDGEQLRVDQLVPIPGGSEVLVHTRAGELLRWDTAGSDPPALVGGYTGIVALAADGRRASVVTAAGVVELLDLGTGETSPLRVSPLEGVEPRAFDGIVPLADGDQLERLAFAADDLRSFDFVIARDDGTRAEVLYAPDGDAGILDWTVTGNETYLLVEITPDGEPSSFDGYARSVPPASAETLVIALANGEVIARLPGHSLRW